MLFSNTNAWREGMQDASSAIDETMGELVSVTPYVGTPRPNFPAVPDPARAVTVTAVFTNKAKSVIMGENSGRIASGHSISPIVSTSEPIFSFGYGVLPFPLMQGYRIMRLCNRALYEVTDAKPDGVSRIEVKVVRLGIAEEEF
ncbi:MULTISPECIES: hypothetical protein [unclassified Bradyrhizobium]|uniref:hypothetical protein n=1 Tax=unclassified Bradyrhizobium TaxID=2631580 RepID=UPI001FFA53B3|nr:MULTISPECIES: hypothetical protein [unclassified Bradyrhizobium]MCK1611045.1 hypothetical protein [Bradyrhizobium sp. 163]MCK1762799.1 hypothetical protein [Bradyrhizobium sp. 136]